MLRPPTAVILAACLLLSGCSAPAPIVTLEAALAAAEAATAALAASGTIPPSDAALAAVYLIAVSRAVAESSAEMQSADAPALQASKIAGYFAAAVLPLGMSPALAAALAATAAAVQTYLVSVGAASAGAASARTAGYRAIPHRWASRLYGDQMRAQALHSRLVAMLP